MGMDLIREGGCFRMSGSTWSHALELAHLNGWEPAGTESPVWHDEKGKQYGPVPDWDGGYWSNDYQGVTAKDARNLADALERSLPDVPSFDVLEGKRTFIVEKGDGSAAIYDSREAIPAGEKLVGTGIPSETVVTPMEVFSGEKGKEYLRDFIAFCRAGAFCIG